MYRKSNRKSGSLSRNIGSPQYFHFRFGRQRPPDARFCSIWPISPPYRSWWSGDLSKRSRSSRYTTSGSVVSTWLMSSVKVRVLQHRVLRRAVVVQGYRKSNRKSGSLSRNIGSPPYFHFRFSLQRPSDARFCSILANMAAVSLVMVRRRVQEVKVVCGIPLLVRSRLADLRVV